MSVFYNIAIYITNAVLHIVAFFNSKMKLFVAGRKQSFAILQEHIQPSDKTIWFHCASLGEYEQGVPIMEAFKKQYPAYKIIVTFFSPSGYEVKKNTKLADTVLYLPMDTANNAKKFVQLAHPQFAIFIKYEVWPNYLKALKKQYTHTILASGLFRENQIYFKSYGNFMRKALANFDHLFVQNKISETLLKQANIYNVSVSGDTRFDRVSYQIEMDNTLPFIEDFKGDHLCIVCGSTWPEDEVVLLQYINRAPSQVKFIIAPHKIEHLKIEHFTKNIKKPVVLFSKKEHHNLKDAQVFIIDTVGFLTKIYSYADIAYVGGAMGITGLHNILEPATFGVPVIIGNNYNKFPEAIRLRSLAGLFSISNPEECTTILTKLVEDHKLRSKTGMICEHFINSNTGATKSVMHYIQKTLK